MERFKWYLRQLLPLKYKSNYYAQKMNLETGDIITEKAPVTCTWRMWLGFCFSERYSSGWS